MLRFVWIAALVSILCIVLYIPSAVPAERFLEILKTEHAVNRTVWGQDIANRIMNRMLDMQQVTQSISTPPALAAQIGQQSAVDAAMASQVSQVSVRLFRNPYFRSIDTLFVLVSYRLSAMVELLPLLLIFLAVAAVDGLVLRAVRAKEFIPLSAEMFGASAIGGIALGSMVVVSMFLPLSLHPMHVTACLLVMLFVLSRALANYHSIG